MLGVRRRLERQKIRHLCVPIWAVDFGSQATGIPETRAAEIGAYLLIASFLGAIGAWFLLQTTAVILPKLCRGWTFWHYFVVRAPSHFSWFDNIYTWPKTWILHLGS